MSSADDLVALAITVASEAHGTQVDKNGHSYLGHLGRVAWAVTEKDMPINPMGPILPVVVAWLHDTLEDSELLPDDLFDLGFPADVVHAVTALTHLPNEPYDDYIARVRTDYLATIVKRADVLDNLDPSRLASLDTKTRERLTRKYTKALNALGAA